MIALIIVLMVTLNNPIMYEEKSCEPKKVLDISDQSAMILT